MKIVFPSLLVLVLVLSAACTKEGVYGNIYDGMQKREEIVNPSDEPVTPKQPSYDQYKKEREEILDESSG